MADSSAKPRIALGADRAGVRAKENTKKYLEGAGYRVDDAQFAGERHQRRVDKITEMDQARAQ